MDRADYIATRKAIGLAIKHVVNNGFDDIFKAPVFFGPLELNIIRENEGEFTKYAEKLAVNFIKVNNLEVERIGNIDNFMIPRDEFSFRKVSWIDPFDLVKYLSVAILIYPYIERGRPPKEQGYVHSHRLSDRQDELFDSSFGYNSFRNRSRELTNQRIGQWKIITDIANFFDRIGNHPLENHLGDLGCDSKHIRLVREILLQWAGDRRSFGVPVGSDPSRIISEAALVAVDRKLIERGIVFTRYVDDYRIFARTRSLAYDYMRIFSELLSEEGLSVNHKKTQFVRILDSDVAHEEIVEGIHQEHESIDEEQRLEVQRRIVISGRASISRFYREPGREAILRLRQRDKLELARDVRASVGQVQEEKIREYVKYFLYVDQDIAILQYILDVKLTSIFYIVDALIKDHGKLSKDKKKMVKDAIFDSLDYKDLSYPFQIPLLRLSGNPEYADSRLANHVVDQHKLSDNQLFFREAILLGFQQMDRYRIRNLATHVFRTAPSHVRRAIYYCILNYHRMGEEEKRPIVKNMKQAADDWFISRMRPA